jgi:hypothetical protein
MDRSSTIRKGDEKTCVNCVLSHNPGLTAGYRRSRLAPARPAGGGERGGRPSSTACGTVRLLEAGGASGRLGVERRQ